METLYENTRLHMDSRTEHQKLINQKQKSLSNRPALNIHTRQLPIVGAGDNNDSCSNGIIQYIFYITIILLLMYICFIVIMDIKHRTIVSSKSYKIPNAYGYI